MSLTEVEPHLLWHCSFYDGPLDGICLWQDRIWWFEVEDALTDPRAYLIYALSPLEVARECEQHFVFELLVGAYTCHHPGTSDEIATTRENWQTFYEKYPEERFPRGYQKNRTAIFRAQRWAPR